MFFACKQCSSVWDVQGARDEIIRLLVIHPRWNDSKRVCPYCSGEMAAVTSDFKKQLRIAIDAGIIEPVTLTPTEAFGALCGIGTPEQVSHGIEAVEAYLLTSRIIKVRAAMTSTGRVVLGSLDLQNGLTVHLTASPHGACVLKITRRTDVPAMDHVQLDIFEGSEDHGLHGRAHEGSGVQERGGGRGNSPTQDRLCCCRNEQDVGDSARFDEGGLTPVQGNNPDSDESGVER